MKNKILKFLLILVLSLSVSTIAYADTKTGLIGKFEFDGDLENAVTGKDAIITGRKVNEDVIVDDVLYTNGVTKDALLIDGYASGYGLELLDCVPKSNTFTISYDIFYTAYSPYSSTIFMNNSTENIDYQWASFGWAWRPDMNSAPGLWIHDMLERKPAEWIDFFPANQQQLIDSNGEFLYWTNITYIIDKGVAKIYVNGVCIDEYISNVNVNTAIFNIVNNDTRIFVGVNGWDNPISAAIDNLYIYNRALTADDVKELISGRSYESYYTKEDVVQETTSNKPHLADKDNADYLVPVETTTAQYDNVDDLLVSDKDNDEENAKTEPERDSYNDVGKDDTKEDDADSKNDEENNITKILIIIIVVASIVFISSVVTVIVLLKKGKK